MGHEKTRDFEAEGRHFLAPSVIDGKDVPFEQVIQMVLAGKMRPTAQASTPQAIKQIAEQRTHSFDQPSKGLK